MKLHYVEQRSPEWYDIRKGHITASSFHTFCKSYKDVNVFNDTQLKILYKLAAEIMTGEPSQENGYSSKPMSHGVAQEDEARDVFEMETGLKVDLVGFIEKNEYVGCSPDGLIGDDGYLELKNPESRTHVSYLDCKQNLIDEYEYQIQGGLWVSGRTKGYLVSYDSRMLNSDKQLVIAEVEPNQELFAKFEERIAAAILYIKNLVGEDYGD